MGAPVVSPAYCVEAGEGRGGGGGGEGGHEGGAGGEGHVGSQAPGRTSAMTAHAGPVIVRRFPLSDKPFAAFFDEFPDAGPSGPWRGEGRAPFGSAALLKRV